MKEIIKIRAGINKNKMGKQQRTSKNPKDWSFTISTKLIKLQLERKRKRTQILRPGMKGDITTNLTENKRILKEYYEQLNANDYISQVKSVYSQKDRKY